MIMGILPVSIDLCSGRGVAESGRSRESSPDAASGECSAIHLRNSVTLGRAAQVGGLCRWFPGTLRKSPSMTDAMPGPHHCGTTTFGWVGLARMDSMPSAPFRRCHLRCRTMARRCRCRQRTSAWDSTTVGSSHAVVVADHLDRDGKQTCGGTVCELCQCVRY